MPAKFVIKKGTTGKFRFNLHAANGQIIATSESYETKRACLQGVKSVQTNAAKAAVEDTTVAKPAKKAAAKKSTKKSAAKKSAAKKSTKKSAAKKSAAKKSTKRAAANKAPARKTARKSARRR